MLKRVFIILCILFGSFLGQTQEDEPTDIQGGIDVGLSSTKLFIDSLDTKRTVMPLLGFSFQKQLIPKLYFGFSSVFTQKNSNSISPSLKYKLNFIDWRLSLMFKPTLNLYLEAGGAISQFLNGKVKYSNGDEFNQNDEFLNQINPFLGLKYKVNGYGFNVKYYLPNVLTNLNSFAQTNQFSYAEISINIPFDKLVKDEEVNAKEVQDENQAKKDINALKSGILLVALSGTSSKEVTDNEIDRRLVEAMKHYGFSKFFIVDKSDIKMLRNTNKIAVYESYPFTEKQTISLENFEWFVLEAGKTEVYEGENSEETFNTNALVIFNKKGDRLKPPFPYFVNFSKNNLDAAVKSLNSNLERYYYEASFGM